jgi:tetratricopeptide (TPR) repeat protein
MATKSKIPELLSDLLAKAEEDFKVSRNSVKTIETLKKIKSMKSFGNNQRFKTLLDNSTKCISEEHLTSKIIFTIATLNYSQSDDKTSIRWLLKYVTKLYHEVSFSESKNIEKCLAAEYMIGCCYFNMNNYKMAYKSLAAIPPDPSNDSKFKEHCNMLTISCESLKLRYERVMYEALCKGEENPFQSALNIAKIRTDNAKKLIQFGKISGAKMHLKQASDIMCNCEDEQIVWAHIADCYKDLRMYPEANKCRQKFVDSFNGQNLDPPPQDLVGILLEMAGDNNRTLTGNYHRAIEIAQHVLELLEKAPEGNRNRAAANFAMGDAYCFLNDFGLAIKYYEETLEEMKKGHKYARFDLDYCHLSEIWLRISEAQILSGSYQVALKSGNKSEKYLKMAPGKCQTPGKYLIFDAQTAVQLSYCWRKLERPQKAMIFMNSALKALKKLKKNEEEAVLYPEIDHMIYCKMVYIGMYPYMCTRFFSGGGQPVQGGGGGG